MSSDVPANLVLFGYSPVAARLEAERRNRATRRTRALLVAGATLVLAPVAGLLPPHIPWALGVLIFGGFLAYKQWNAAWRVHAFEGACPACGEPLELEADSLINLPTTLTCYNCHQEPKLTVA